MNKINCDEWKVPIKEIGPTPRAKRLASEWFFNETSELLNAKILSSSSTMSLASLLKNIIYFTSHEKCFCIKYVWPILININKIIWSGQNMILIKKKKYVLIRRQDHVRCSCPGLEYIHTCCNVCFNKLSTMLPKHISS